MSLAQRARRYYRECAAHLTRAQAQAARIQPKRALRIKIVAHVAPQPCHADVPPCAQFTKLCAIDIYNDAT